MLVSLALEAEKNGNHHHANSKRQRTPYHGCAAADSIDEERREEAAENEHDLNAAADDHGQVMTQADVPAENSGDKVSGWR